MTKHKFKPDQRLRCIATPEQLDEIDIHYAASIAKLTNPRFTRKAEPMEQPTGAWSSNKYNDEPVYRFDGFFVPESFLKATR